MRDREQLIEALINEWEALNVESFLPKESIKLISEEECVVYLENSWGPAVPYPAVDHGNGEQNHGYRRVKDDLDAINFIPEAQGWPEYESFLRNINSKESAIESVGCEKSFFPVNNHPAIKVKIGSYTDIIFSDFALNNDPKNILSLAATFAVALNGSATWWSSAELGIQRLKLLYEQKTPWSLMLRISGHGRTEEEARKTWAMSLEKISESVLLI